MENFKQICRAISEIKKTQSFTNILFNQTILCVPYDLINIYKIILRKMRAYTLV